MHLINAVCSHYCKFVFSLFLLSCINPALFSVLRLVLNFSQESPTTRLSFEVRMWDRETDATVLIYCLELVIIWNVSSMLQYYVIILYPWPILYCQCISNNSNYNCLIYTEYFLVMPFGVVEASCGSLSGPSEILGMNGWMLVGFDYRLVL